MEFRSLSPSLPVDEDETLFFASSLSSILEMLESVLRREVFRCIRGLGPFWSGGSSTGIANVC